MRLVGLVVAGLLSFASAAEVDATSAVATHSRALEDAQPSGLGDICTSLLEAGLGAVIPEVVGSEESPVTCECNPTLFPSLSISLTCASSDPVCLPPDIICGTPSIEVGLDVSALLDGANPISFDACFAGLVIAGTIPIIEVLGPLCFSLVLTLLGSVGIGPGLDSTNATTADLQAESTRTCKATLSGQECNSCTVCDGGLGLEYDCSNIEVDLKSNQCAHMNLPTTLRDVYHPDKLVSS
jgi:hypothetical protein